MESKRRNLVERSTGVWWTAVETGNCELVLLLPVGPIELMVNDPSNLRSRRGKVCNLEHNDMFDVCTQINL